MQHRPGEAVPENGGKDVEYHDRKKKIVDELSHKGGNIALDTKCQLAVGTLFEKPADGEVEKIVHHSRDEKRHRTAHEDEPSATQYAVKGGIVVCRGGNDAGNVENGAGEKIDQRRQDRNAVGGAWTEMLGDDVHTDKGQPGDENAAVNGNIGGLHKSFVGKKIHGDDADHE